MEDQSEQSLLQRIHARLTTFFPEQVITHSMIEEELEAGDLFYRAPEFLPYLQTALMDEKIIEVEFNGSPRVYFSRLHDHLPPLEQIEVDGETRLEEPEYAAGDYLQQMSHLITLPVEPGIGNIFVRHTQSIVLRFFTTNYAVELGTFFQELTEVRGLPVLRLDYPSIGRIVHGAREFRAKVPDQMKLMAMIMGKRKHGTIRARMIDISANGMAFAIAKEQQELFRVDETRTLEIVFDDLMLVRVNAKVRHISKVRGKTGTQFICGVNFDLVTRSVAAKVESVVAQVQRAHLKEISELSEQSGINLVV